MTCTLEGRFLQWVLQWKEQDLVSRSRLAGHVDLDVTSDGGKLDEIGSFWTVTIAVQDLFLLLIGPS